MMAVSLRRRSFLSVADLTPAEVEEVLRVTAEQKSGRVPAEQLSSIARGRNLAILFDKSSLRTRVGFEVAINQLGAHAVYLAPADIRLGEREPVRDVARVLGRMVDGIIARLSSHEYLHEFASSSGVPVINAMSNLEHPCQALADLMTIKERKGKLSEVELAWIGDGNNVCHSLLLIASMFGVRIRIATPATYEPRTEVLQAAAALAKASGAKITVWNDPQQAAAGADVIETDVWVSAGMEEQSRRRRLDFKGFQVNMELLKQAKPDAIVLHCLPAHRGEEIADEVMESEQCAAWEQAENRLHTQRALLSLIFS
jgi:ornithine carbamoyltransferase